MKARTSTARAEGALGLAPQTDAGNGIANVSFRNVPKRERDREKERARQDHCGF